MDIITRCYSHHQRYNLMYFLWLVGHIIPLCIKAMIHLLGIALGLWDFQMQLCSSADVAHCKLLDNEDLDLGG